MLVQPLEILDIFCNRYNNFLSKAFPIICYRKVLYTKVTKVFPVIVIAIPHNSVCERIKISCKDSIIESAICDFWVIGCKDKCEILMIIMVFSPNQHLPKNMQHSESQEVDFWENLTPFLLLSIGYLMPTCHEFLLEPKNRSKKCGYPFLHNDNQQKLSDFSLLEQVYRVFFYLCLEKHLASKL